MYYQPLNIGWVSGTFVVIGLVLAAFVCIRPFKRIAKLREGESSFFDQNPLRILGDDLFEEKPVRGLLIVGLLSFLLALCLMSIGQ
jgi:hypothetical protein